MEKNFFFIFFLVMTAFPSLGRSDCEILAGMEQLHYNDYVLVNDMHGPDSPLTIAKYNQWEGTFIVWLEFCTIIEAPSGFP